MNRVNGATILVNPFVLYRMIILPSPFKPIIASIKWKVSNNEGIIVARCTPCYAIRFPFGVLLQILSRSRSDGERWSSVLSGGRVVFLSFSRKKAGHEVPPCGTTGNRWPMKVLL